ncbi:prepilin-type N-terminal cleavage/methylation domain-containing protein [Akkermansiaceae bacterium]|nr:prepilin-type N-terminal cleavage/methylation domain-containing protein [Akkermansiaceae bacterium]
MKTRPTHPEKARSGFTLIELLVSMAITSVLMLALFSLVGQSTASYTQNQRAVNAVSQARAFLQFFDRELSTRLPATRLIHETDPGSSATDKIAFVRVISADEELAADPGDLNTPFYYVAFSADGADSESPKLFRGNLGAAETQALLTAGGSPAFPDADPATDEPIVPNIIAFQARPKFLAGNPAAPQDWTDTSPERPSIIELSVSFIDDSSARRFRTRADWQRLATSPRDSELQLIRTFTRTIAIAK